MSYFKVSSTIEFLKNIKWFVRNGNLESSENFMIALYIKDFMNNENVMSFDCFQTCFGVTAETQLVYNIIYNSLVKIESNLKQSFIYSLTEDNSKPSYFRGYEIGKINRKSFLKLINEKQTLSICKEWRDSYNVEEENTNVWSVSRNCTSEIRLIQLQWKILHRIYPTGTLLYKMKIKDKEECDFCGERDTIPHFFAKCPLSQKLWIEAERKVSSYLGKIIKFEEKIILLGIWCKHC